MRRVVDADRPHVVVNVCPRPGNPPLRQDQANISSGCLDQDSLGTLCLGSSGHKPACGGHLTPKPLVLHQCRGHPNGRSREPVPFSAMRHCFHPADTNHLMRISDVSNLDVLELLKDVLALRFELQRELKLRAEFLG